MSSDVMKKIGDDLEYLRDKAVKQADYDLAQAIRTAEDIAKSRTSTPPATAKLPEGVVVCAMPDGRYHVRGCGWWLLKQGRWEKMTLPTHEYPGEFVSHDDALTAALSAPPVPGESKAATIDHANSNWIDTMSARIAELEAEVANMRGVVRVATKLRDEGGKNLGTVDELHYALASLGLHTPAEKPDPRLTAPNGRAMVEWRRVDDAHVIGRDDSCQWWFWLYGEMSWEPCRLDPELFKPCAFDGTPITETKPDPLARAVTVGEMLRLADLFEEKSFYKKAIRTVFPQGAAHAE